jgi:hypothetical protein
MVRLLKSQLPLVIAGLCALLLPTAVHAQAFSFSIGSSGHGHHHHGHRYHGCSPCWGPHFYGPAFGFAYAPAPVYRERVVYVEPPRTTTVIVPQAAAVAPTLAPLASNSLPADGSIDGRIVIRNASGARLPVAFLVDGQDVELADGQTRVFAGSRHNIHYDRGGRFGGSQQALAGGNYDFRITPSGWDLVRQPDVTPATTAVRTNALPEQR